MRTENWKPIPGWPYEVSSMGRVRRTVLYLNSKPDGIVKPLFTKPGGSPAVFLSNNNKVKRFILPRLVCEAFHGKSPSESHHAAHINGDTKDNREENLYWATRSENERDKCRQKAGRESCRPGRLTKTDAVAVMAMMSTGRFTKQDIAKSFDVSDGMIGHIANGRAHVKTMRLFQEWWATQFKSEWVAGNWRIKAKV